MPLTEVIFYCNADGTAPVKEWLEGQSNKKVKGKCISYINRLEAFGYELRRPTVDLLRDDIYELRPTYMNVHYRILYFFSQGKAVLAHGCSKEGEVDDSDIERAILRKRKFQANPKLHTYTEAD